MAVGGFGNPIKKPEICTIITANLEMRPGKETLVSVFLLTWLARFS
jgi:hypothetical protein